MLVRVVEDHPDLAELLRLELIHAGFDVDVRTVGFATLLDVGEWEDIDAAVFDLQLGDDVTGGDLVLFVAEHAPHVRRVILTATLEVHLTPDVRAAAHVVLGKPTALGRIAEALRAR